MINGPIYSDYLRELAAGWGPSGGPRALGPIYSEYLAELARGW